jgi:hypothetical protein
VPTIASKKNAIPKEPTVAIELFVSPKHAAKQKRMSTASCKAKGRRLQDSIRDSLRKIGAELFGLEPDDIKCAIMGTSGVDIVLTPSAKKVFNLDVEAKNVEILNVVGTFWKHFDKYASRPTLKVLIHKKNFKEALITFRLEDFWPLYRKALLSNATPGQATGEHDAPQV